MWCPKKAETSNLSKHSMAPVPGEQKKIPEEADAHNPLPNGTPDSQATTIPGDDAQAQQMARENNAKRLAELSSQQLKTPEHLIRKSGTFTSAPPPLTRAVSDPLFGKEAPEKTKGKKSSNKPGKHGKKQHKGNRKTAKKHVAAKKKLKTVRKAATKPGAKPQKATTKQPTTKQPTNHTPPTQQALPAPESLPAPNPAQAQMPVPTPARSEVPPPSGTHPDVAALLNRAGTLEQLTPGTPRTSPGTPLPSATPSQAEPDKKARELAQRARKGRFFRTLESCSLSIFLAVQYPFSNSFVTG